MKREFSSVMKMSQKWIENLNFTFEEKLLTNLKVDFGPFENEEKNIKEVIGFGVNSKVLIEIIKNRHRVKALGPGKLVTDYQLVVKSLNDCCKNIKTAKINKILKDKKQLLESGGDDFTSVQLIMEGDSTVWIPRRHRLVRYHVEKNRFFEIKYYGHQGRRSDINGMISAVVPLVSHCNDRKRFIFGTTTGQIYVVFYKENKVVKKFEKDSGVGAESHSFEQDSFESRNFQQESGSFGRESNSINSHLRPGSAKVLDALQCHCKSAVHCSAVLD